MNRMTSRDKILAALRGLPVDRIPFAPLIDPYTLEDMPDEIMGGDQAGYQDLSGLRAILNASRKLGCDIMLRHVPLFRAQEGNSEHFQILDHFTEPFKVSVEAHGAEWIEKLHTPYGSLCGKWGFSQLSHWSAHPIQFPVTTPAELDIFDSATDFFSEDIPIPEAEIYDQIEREIGEDGIATASFPVSPLMYMIEEMCGLDHFYFLLQDRKEQMEAIFEKLHRSNLRLAAAMASTPVQVIIGYEDTSTTLMSPAIFRKYCRPYLNEYARIFKNAGKVFLVHMCGKLRSLVPDLASMECAGFSDISPSPTGDLPLNEAAALLPGKVVIGGIDPNLFVCPDEFLVRKTVKSLIEQLAPFRGVILGSADTMPRGTRVENVRLIRELVGQAR